MHGDSKGHKLSIMEAINILSSMSEIDSKDFSEKGGEAEQRGERVSHEEVDWKDPRQALLYEPVIRQAFSVLHSHLQNIVRNDQSILKDAQTMRGIEALMLLAQEGALKMDHYAKVHLSKHKQISGLKEYTDLQKYYRQHILHQMAPRPEAAEEWEKGLEGIDVAPDATRKGLSDLEVVRCDERYELFYIQNENKQCYFNRSLLRHIRLIGAFDEFIGKVEGEDPLLKLHEVFDKQLYEGARRMLDALAPYIDDFYKSVKIQKDQPLAWNMNKALMALRMAANPKNLIENQGFKSCLEYYSDMHRFLRLSMRDPGYTKRISGEVDEQDSGQIMLRMIHVLCCQLFMRQESRAEGVKFIHLIAKRGRELLGLTEKARPVDSRLEMWQGLRERDACIRHLLKHYPNGPILRILDAFRQGEELEGFDPLMHKNFPNLQFSIENKDLHLSVLRLPCPTRQVFINQAEVIEEFYGLLRFYRSDFNSGKHLIVNLQNRTCIEEYARCKALEDAVMRAEIHDQFCLLGIPKGTPFYHQEGEYRDLESSPLFIKQFSTQILGGTDYGYFLPAKLKMHQHEDLIKDAMALCHRVFFDNKEHLSYEERLNFIEIFYTLYTLQVIDLLQIDSVSFSCKDAIDVGAGQAVVFYVLMRLVSAPEQWSAADLEQIEWMLYAPALFVRERPILEQVLKRSLMAAKHIHATCLKKKEGVGQALNALYSRVKFPFKITDKG